tara:strand:+ start:83 stop:313 length:231 start_codon:yes stop_codon:yes gene_type:complete
MAAGRVKTLQDMLATAIANEDQDQIDIIKAELFQINANYKKDGGEVKKYHKGGEVKKKKSKVAGRLAQRGYGKARK